MDDAQRFNGRARWEQAAGGRRVRGRLDRSRRSGVRLRDSCSKKESVISESGGCSYGVMVAVTPWHRNCNSPVTLSCLWSQPEAGRLIQMFWWCRPFGWFLCFSNTGKLRENPFLKILFYFIFLPRSKRVKQSQRKVLQTGTNLKWHFAAALMMNNLDHELLAAALHEFLTSDRKMIKCKEDISPN